MKAPSVCPRTGPHAAPKIHAAGAIRKGGVRAVPAARGPRRAPGAARRLAWSPELSRGSREVSRWVTPGGRMGMLSRSRGRDLNRSCTWSRTGSCGCCGCDAGGGLRQARIPCSRFSRTAVRPALAGAICAVTARTCGAQASGMRRQVTVVRAQRRSTEMQAAVSGQAGPFGCCAPADTRVEQA